MDDSNGMDLDISGSIKTTRSSIAEIKDNKEIWIGLSDPAERRKLQNRLHQRAWRKRKALERKDAESESVYLVPAQIICPKNRIAEWDSGSESSDGLSSALAIRLLQQAGQTHSTTDHPWGEALPTCTEVALRQPNDNGEQDHVEPFISSPTTELLLRLIKYNVFRACCMNIESLGLKMEIMGSKILSPFTLKHDPQYWSKVLPPPLQPTALQANLPHHPYVDVLACAKMRDVILQFGAAIDAHELCADLMGNGLDGHSGIIVWGDPWVPESWEVTEEFVKKWRWLLLHMPEVVVFANAWRTKRDEPLLVL